MASNEQGARLKSRWANSFSNLLVPAAIAAAAFAVGLAGAQVQGSAPRGEDRNAAAASSRNETSPKRLTEILDPEFEADLKAEELCDSAMWEELHKAGNAELAVTCSLSLAPTETITRKLVYAGSAASGATLFCQCEGDKCATLTGGITIATKGDDDWPHDITVQNCRVTDADVRIENFTSNESTRRQDFETWIRARAPRRITFDNIKIDGVGKDRFYVGWGATEVKLINSSVSGKAKGVPVYLGPQSSGTLLKNNRFETITFKDTSGWREIPLLGYVIGAVADSYAREMVTIDSSDKNKIIGNWFGGKLSHGGIYLFRNCGEEGATRHTTPSRNQIINNAFRYRHYNGSSPAIFLGSRNGVSPGLVDYCDKDDGYDVGSSKDDRDFATNNIVMQNEIIERPLSGAIRSLNWMNNAMNLVDYNQSVGSAPWPRLPAGCFVQGGAKDFILHGETTERFMDDGGAPTCGRVTCRDGELRPVLLSDITAPQDGVAAPTAGGASAGGSLDNVAPRDNVVPPAAASTNFCATRRVPFDCRIGGDNSGCRQEASCPAGTKIVGAVAACNLESEAVSDAEVATVPFNLIHAARLSDHVPSGSCWVDGNKVIGRIEYIPQGRGTSLAVIPQSAVQSAMRNIAGRSSVEVGCKEYDDNGGDCHIRGALYCR